MMARDDYHVIVYQILSYLYKCLKHGERVDAEILKPNSTLIRVNERYWEYIIINLQAEGLVRGICITKAYGGGVIIDNLSGAEITPAGIEYLCDNSFMQKAKELAGTLFEIAPFIIQ